MFRFQMTLALMALLAVPAYALPPDQFVTYQIHEDPNDPESSIVFTVNLALKAKDCDSNRVGWEIVDANFKQIEPGNIRAWEISGPEVPSEDGFWWVEHADNENPTLDEFTEPPHLTGTATAVDYRDPDLEYDLEGLEYTPPEPPDEPPYETTSLLDYFFILVGASTPEEEGDGEPAETSDDAGNP